MATFPNHRVSNKEKQTEEWYINAYEYYLAMSRAGKNDTEVEDMLNAANGIIGEDTYKYVLEPLSGEQDSVKNLPGTIRNVDFLTPIKEKNIGEYIELPYKFQVLVNDPEVVSSRDLEINKRITAALEQELINILNKNGIETGIESQPVPDLEVLVKNIRDSWFDERAQIGQDVLNLINQENNFDIERIQNFFYWWATEQFYIHHYISNGTVIRETINPLDAYPLENGEQFVEDYDGFIIRNSISWEQFVAKYRNRLSASDRKVIEELQRNRSVSGELSISNIFITQFTKRTWMNTSNSSSYKFDSNNHIYEYKIFFKTEVKKNILKYENALGEILERIVDDDFDIDGIPGAEIVEEWIPEVWCGGIVGNITDGGARVYLKPEPYEVQRYDSQFNCKLPISGKKGLLNSNSLNPVPYRILPYLALFRIYTLQQERAIAKFKGSIMAIPKSMLTSGEQGAKGVYFYMKADNSIIYDDSQITPQEVSVGFKVVQDSGLERFIVAMNELRKQMKEEAWELANMNEPRAGDINPSAGKGVTEQAIYRAKLGSILMMYVFNKAMEKSHEIDLELSKVAFIDGKSGYYVDENNEPVFVNIDGVSHFQTPYALYVTNAKTEDDKLKAFKDMAFSASQNGDFDLAAEAITANNSITIKRSIERYMEEKRKFEQAMEDRKNEAMVQAEQIKKDTELSKQEHEINKIYVEQELITERELLLKSSDPEADNSLDVAIKDIELRLKERKQMLDERKQTHQEQQDNVTNLLKDKQIKSQEKIAKMNKN